MVATGPNVRQGRHLGKRILPRDAGSMEGSELGVTPTVMPVLVAERSELKRRA